MPKQALYNDFKYSVFLQPSEWPILRRLFSIVALVLLISTISMGIVYNCNLLIETWIIENNSHILFLLLGICLQKFFSVKKNNCLAIFL